MAAAALLSHKILSVVILAFQLTSLLVHAQATLELYTAGRSSVLVRKLQPVDKICNDAFTTPGYNIKCVGQTFDSFADFYIDGVFEKRESKSPFFIGGDKLGVPYNWKRAPKSGTARIECKLSSGTTVSVVTFSCDSQQISPLPQPSIIRNPPLRKAKMYFVVADGRTPAMLSRKIEVKSRMVFCPMRELGSYTISVLCASDGQASTTARILVDREVVQDNISSPFLIAGQITGSNGVPLPWTNIPAKPFRIECSLSTGISRKAKQVLVDCPGGPPTGQPGPSSSVSPTFSKAPIPSHTSSASPTQTPLVSRTGTPVPSSSSISSNEKDRAGCVIIDVGTATPSNGWVRESEGLSFQPNNMATSITSANKAPLYFSFRPLQTSRHAVVVDMTTSGSSDFNDVWIHVENGFQLMRSGVAQNVTGWIKGYHNKKGRAAMISHVDRNAHSIASANILETGVEYTFGLGGRSNRVTVHQILLFPCAGTGCQRGAWKNTQNICLPGSL